MVELTTVEVIEIGKSKVDHTPNLGQDDIEAARAAARAERNATWRKEAKKVSEEYSQRNIQPALEEFNNEDNVETQSTDTVKETVVATEEATSTDTIQEAIDAGDIDPAQKIKIKGKEYTWQQVADGFTKVEDADGYLAAAAKQIRSTVPTTPPPVVLSVPEDNPEEDNLLAQALQEGTKEDIVKVIKTIRNQSIEIANKAMIQQKAQQDAYAVYQRVLAENKDITSDPQLLELARRQDEKLFKENKVFDAADTNNNFYLRFTDAVKQIREWDTSRRQVDVNTSKKQQLIDKKKKLVTLNSKASERVAATNVLENNTPTFNSPEEYNRYVVEQMRNKTNGRRKIMYQSGSN